MVRLGSCNSWGGIEILWRKSSRGLFALRVKRKSRTLRDFVKRANSMVQFKLSLDDGGNSTLKTIHRKKSLISALSSQETYGMKVGVARFVSLRRGREKKTGQPGSRDLHGGHAPLTVRQRKPSWSGSDKTTASNSFGKLTSSKSSISMMQQGESLHSED